LLRRYGGAIVLLLSAVGIICCASGIIGVWLFYQSVSEKVQTISATPLAKLEGREPAIFAGLDRKLEAARETRKQHRQAALDGQPAVATT
jgi:hypothetical protein